LPRGFDDLVRQGKVFYVGVSDAAAWWIAKANTLAALRGWSPFVALQIEYSLLERTPERELLPMAAGFGLSVTAWSPLDCVPEDDCGHYQVGSAGAIPLILKGSVSHLAEAVKEYRAG
jgi:diketogulonate reductase-like aldo/keto reductase